MISCDNLLGYSFADLYLNDAKPGKSFTKKNTPATMRNETEANITRSNNTDLADEVYDLIRLIKDPEKPQTLEELNVVSEGGISVDLLAIDNDVHLIRIEFVPTVPHCSLATLIGLTLRTKLERNLSHKFKLDIFIRKGTHSTEDEINKQINDKERIAAAMENPNLLSLVNSCIEEIEY